MPSGVPGLVNDSRCDNSSTEAGVLIAYHHATARSLPKEELTIIGGSQPPLTTRPRPDLSVSPNQKRDQRRSPDARPKELDIAVCVIPYQGLHLNVCICGLSGFHVRSL
ncbi:hypothetical protein AVEN_225903-1 [Araneus ventricosus]|uniref:Uncharacterized protein n=1 Tax=Araneus ventricosus TaxID=182803 RepID=A0A4Y2BB14_ARAVE|nr:hypothetical protein AVEN_225903-1 [Araneus ventricosus]